jgi:hypothetical protein
VVQETIDAVGFDLFESTGSESDSTGELLAISGAAMTGTEAPSTFCLVGQIQKQQVLMLVDSGSSHCFANERVAERLKGTVKQLQPLQVKIANGGMLTCEKELTGCEWWCHGATFRSNLKVLPLGGYDIIIGMDWLQSHNPMGIDWVGKRMAFWNEGKLVLLAGIQAQIGSGQEVDARALISLLQQASVIEIVELQLVETDSISDAALPAEIDGALQKFSQVFADPGGLPPARQFDHATQLIDGAKPVNVRPYRYIPAQKDEIEKQIAEMLRQGIIR